MVRPRQPVVLDSCHATAVAPNIDIEIKHDPLAHASGYDELAALIHAGIPSCPPNHMRIPAANLRALRC
jgi:hypothetical protein